MSGVRQRYESSLLERGYQSDPAQLAAVDALERCETGWLDYLGRRKSTWQRWVSSPPIPRGVYLYGGVGRGKSFLMDAFFHASPVKRKIRLHFHEFMREVHRELQVLKGVQNPIDALGQKMARRHRLICFDEFHVSDVTDAMILHRVLEALVRHRIGLITTSNFHPDALYPNGLHRDRILPAIELLKSQLEVVNVDHGTDYRRRTLEQVPMYHCAQGASGEARMQVDFDALAEVADESTRLHIEERTILAKRRAGTVIWFDFKQLCGGPRSQNDYLEIASQYHTVFLSGVPVMPPSMASQARRFTLLVDVLYDRRCKLIISAEAPAEALYTEGPLAHEFVRTVSRLQEMQSREYLEEERREVLTALT